MNMEVLTVQTYVLLQVLLLVTSCHEVQNCPLGCPFLPPTHAVFLCSPTPLLSALLTHSGFELTGGIILPGGRGGRVVTRCQSSPLFVRGRRRGFRTSRACFG